MNAAFGRTRDAEAIATVAAHLSHGGSYGAALRGPLAGMWVHLPAHTHAAGEVAEVGDRVRTAQLAADAARDSAALDVSGGVA